MALLSAGWEVILKRHSEIGTQRTVIFGVSIQMAWLSSFVAIRKTLWRHANPDAPPVPPGTVFDIVLPVWRAGETLLHARSLAANLFEGPKTIKFIANYEGLAGRSLVSINNRRDVWEGRVARQDTITLTTHIETQAIDPNLPEIVHPLLSPLYALFDFFELPVQLVVDELARLRAGNF